MAGPTWPYGPNPNAWPVQHLIAFTAPPTTEDCGPGGGTSYSDAGSATGETSYWYLANGDHWFAAAGDGGIISFYVSDNGSPFLGDNPDVTWEMWEGPVGGGPSDVTADYAAVAEGGSTKFYPPGGAMVASGRVLYLVLSVPSGCRGSAGGGGVGIYTNQTSPG